MLTSKSFLRGLLILGAAGLLAGPSTTFARAQANADPGIARGTGINLWETPALGDDTALRRATRLLGKPLKNTQGETLGRIEDLVLTPEFNTVSYAVLTRGGFFGFGERRYAIPWSAMRAGVGDAIVAPIDKQELKQDHGFRAKLWPAQGDPRWLSRPGQRTEQVTFDVQPVVEQRDIRRRRVSRILGMSARDPQDNRVGRVRDMLVAVSTGNIPFTIINYGGLMGMGNKYTAVPAHAIQYRPADSFAHILVDEQVLQANAFDPDNFPDLSDPTYAQRIYAAYDVAPQDPDWVVLGYVPPETPGGAQTMPPYPSQMNPQYRPQTAFPGRQQYVQPQYPQSQYPQSQYPQSQYPQSQTMQPQYTQPQAGQSQFMQQPGQTQPMQQPGQNQFTQSQPMQQSGPGQFMAQPGQSPLAGGRQAPQFNNVPPARSEFLSAFAPENLRTIEGLVTGVNSFPLLGTNVEWVQLQVRADDGQLVMVHLGPRDYVSRQDFYVAANDRIRLTGGQATAWRQPIILPITATVGGQTITLRDPTGRPLWAEPPSGQQNAAQSGQQQPSAQPNAQQPGLQPNNGQPNQSAQQPNGSQPAQEGAAQPMQ